MIDSKGQRLAEGYLGEQNKGIGWLLSWYGPINQSFQQLFEISREADVFEKDSLTTAYRLFNGRRGWHWGLIIDRYEITPFFHGIMKPSIENGTLTAFHSLP